MTEALASKTCTPCRGGIPPLTREQAELFHAQAPDWQLVEEAHRIERSFRFRNFREALTFVQEIGELAEAEGHHPNISFGWGNATVSLQTKKIKGLHENDFIMATKIDRRRAIGSEPKPLIEKQTRRKIMSFFERLKTEASAEWRAYTEHPFTNGLADGSLAEAAFRHYLVQDYLFLTEFARAYALSVYKSPKLADMREAAAGLSAILDIEMNLHVKLCAGWGLSPSDLEQTPPAVEMLAYTRYVLDAGMRGDLLALKVALAPCVIGYAEIATRLASRPDAHAATNPYRVWIAEYAGAPYQEVAAKARAHLEGLADLYVTPAREAELIVIFKEATRLEADFWEMGWRIDGRLGTPAV